MKAAFAAVAKVKAAVNEVVHTISGENNAPLRGDEMIDTYLHKLSVLNDTLSVLKDEFLKLSKSYASLQSSTIQISHSFTTTYVSSAQRQPLIQQYNHTQQQIDGATRKFQDLLTTQCIRALDEWQNDNIDVVESVTSVANAKQHVLQTTDKLSTLKRKKFDRQDRGGWSEREEQQLKEAEQQLAKYSAALVNMREKLQQRVSDYLNQRFTRLDAIFLVYLNAQKAYFTAGMAAMANLQPALDDFSKIAPSLSAATATAPTRPPSKSDAADRSSTTSFNAARNNLSSPRSTLGSNNGRPTANGSSGIASNMQYRAPATAHEDSESDAAVSDTESDPYASSEELSDSDTHTKQPPPPQRPVRAHTQSTGSNGSTAAGTADFLNFGGAAAAKPAPASRQNSTASNSSAKPQAKATSNDADFLDFFGASVAPPASSKPKASTTAKPAASSSAAPDFFSFDSSAASESSSNSQPFSPHDFSSAAPKSSSGNGMPSSASYDSFGKAAQQQNSNNANRRTGSGTQSGRGLDSFDAFGFATNTGAHASKAAPSANDIDDHDRSTTRSASDNNISGMGPAAAASGFATSAPLNDSPYSLPYHDFQVEERLDAWDKANGQQRHIRVLLSTLHTVLWNSSGWKPVGLSELLDFNSIKKTNRKAILTVHPDKLVNAPDLTKVVAQRLFTSLNNAFQAFDRQAKTGNLGI